VRTIAPWLLLLPILAIGATVVTISVQVSRLEPKGPTMTPDVPAGGPDGGSDAGSDEESSLADPVAQELAGIRSDLREYRDVIESLHVHNEELRRETLERVQEPVFRDVIKLLDDYRRLAAAWAGRPSAAPADVEAVCVAVTEDLATVLERYGVEEVRPEPGEAFDHREHRVVATSPTGDADRDGVIAGTRAPGYRLGGRVLRYPEVVVHRHVAQGESSRPAEQ
jgi:molecular chaperone GrpE (heat shock protein)